MTRKMELLKLHARRNTLEMRGRDNRNIIHKIDRRLRKLEQEVTL